MKKNSILTPFFAHAIRKMAEAGITNNLSKRYIIPEPTCKPLQPKGRPLGMDKFASLFLFYSICCIISLIILVMENIFKPSKPEFHQSLLLFIKKQSISDDNLKIKIVHIQRQLEILKDDNKAMLIFLLTEVKSLLQCKSCP